MGLSEDLKKPINLISISIGLISLLVSIIIYIASQQVRIPAYLVEEKRGHVFDSKISTPAITVIDKENKAIKEDIYLATSTFWNAGDLPIEPEHIRKSVILTISPVERIIDYSILEQTDPDVSEIKINMLDPLKSQTDTCELELSWLHLDPNHGARIQIMYIGDENANIAFKGAILGVGEFKNAQPLGKRIKIIGTLFSIFLGGSITVFLSSFIDMIRSKNRKKIVLGLLALTVFSIFMYTIYSFLLKGLTPPL